MPADPARIEALGGAEREAPLCDCERCHNGFGMAGRECDCGEKFPQPSRRDGDAPCGECHLKPGETCDICGAALPTHWKPYLRWRRPPGCPDADWCSGNGVCYWNCQEQE